MPARLQDISRNLGIPQSTVLRFLSTYIDFGYVRQDAATASYYLTLKLAGLGSRTKANFPLRGSLEKYVKQIALYFNEAASLCVEENMQMVYIATAEGPDRMLQTLQRIGRVAPMHATGVGKLHLLNYTDEQLETLVKKRSFARFTPRTITELPALKKELEHIREKGYAVDNEECEAGVRCIAVPVRDYTGMVAAALSVSAPVARLDARHGDARYIDDRQFDVDTRFLLGISRAASEECGWGTT
jgi:DNA-binding IclR family transcriptional regulator